MGFRDREIEKKFHTPIEDLEFLVRRLGLDNANIVSGGSTDHYWAIPHDTSAFARLREHEDHFEMTVKKEDQGHYSNRIEIDLKMQPTFIGTIIAYHDVAFGPRTGTIRKVYKVTQIGETKWETLSLYRIHVNGFPVPGTFIEVEGRTLEFVNTFVERLHAMLPNLTAETQSLYMKYLQHD